MAPDRSAKEVILACVQAINHEDFDLARQYLRDDFTFDGVLGSRHGADAYINDMRNLRLKYNIKKIFADENDVCLFYELTMSGTTIFGCAWYQVDGGKVRSLRVVFDPRPILESKAA